MVTIERGQTYEVPLEKLRWRCDPDQFPFVCTEDIEPLGQFIGQERGLRAIEFGLAMDRPGYGIFVTGLTGTGRASMIKAYLQKVAAEKGSDTTGYRPADWCYVFNFADPDRPLALRLPRGKGRRLHTCLEEMVKILRRELVKALTGEDYQAQRKDVVEQSQARQRQLFQSLDRTAQDAGFMLQMGPTGVMLIPVVEGRPLGEEAYLALSVEQREAIEERRPAAMEMVEETFQQARALEKQSAEQIRDLDQRVAEFAIARPFGDLRAEFADLPEVVAYLEAVHAYTLANVELFRQEETTAAAAPGPDKAAPIPGAALKDPFLAYRVNLLVDNAESATAPVIIESNPTWFNLFGKIERRAVMGAYFSDHTMLKAGALGLANGGYLVVNARDLLINPATWEGLKRALRNKELRLEDPQEQFGLLAPQGLRPQPIPLEVKVIITGDSGLYQSLSQLDEDFWEIFKVRADFDHQIDRTPEHVEGYAAFICTTCQAEGLRPLHRSGVARVVEEGVRMVADQSKLSARFGLLRDIIIEADYWAAQEGATMVSAQHVRRAVDEKVYRSSLMAERMRDLITEGTFMVATSGTAVGQVNGLAVYDLGDFSFGRPSRITARTFMGRAGVINIERESQLSGRTHDKGVLILSGFLGARYAQDVPLSMSASVCFEQSYEGVDGDSASATELYAILSSLAGVPLRQGIAITGSVNQQGEIQPIGGVNQKVEGFFDVCQAVGLTGEQGVIIPQANVKNLMLREDVVEAVARGEFHVYAVRSVDEGMAILGGLAVGERGEDGTFAEGSLNWRVGRRLRELAEGLKGFSAS